MLSLAALFFAVSSCQEDPVVLSTAKLILPEIPYSYSDEFPAHFETIENLQLFNGDGNTIFLPDDFGGRVDRLRNSRNPEVTDQGAALGRVLFYDPQLSINNSVACASCHHQQLAFSDGKQFSTGFGGKITPRNSMALINTSINRNLFWDSRIQSVAELISEPIQNHIEMGMESMVDLEKKLSKVPYYPSLFEEAYGSPSVTSEGITTAVAQFLGAMVSGNSKFDKGMTTDFENFTELEKMGKAIFFSEEAKCSSCHAGANFSAPDLPGGEYGGFGTEDRKGGTNIGLDLVSKDNGIANGQFRIPSLRNIALTGPYMHDGRFASLAEVVEHYNSGIKSHPELDDKLTSPTGSPIRLELDALEKQALIAFLHTLTDEEFITDPRFSNPFEN